MQTKKHIFEIKEQMKATGWSCITPAEYQELDYFTQQWIADTVEDKDNFDPTTYDVVLGNGYMFWANEEEEF